MLAGIQNSPDFLVHVPGEMDNHTIIEVKHIKGDMDGFYKDLDTLEKFYKSAGYKKTILLAFGGDLTASQLRRLKGKYQLDSLRAPIEIWSHSVAGQCAERLMTLEPERIRTAARESLI